MRRELRPRGLERRVAATELQEESTYFSVQFVDDDMLVPIMLPLVFIGRNLNSGDVSRIYFQDAESFRRGTRSITSIARLNRST